MAFLVGIAACGSDDPAAACGAGDAAPDGLVLTVGAQSVPFANFTAGANNDCPDGAAPSGVVSLSVVGLAGTQPLTLCVPRPDLLSAGRSFPTEIQLIDLRAANGACTYNRVDGTITGNVVGAGVCEAGAHPDGFALTFDATLDLTETCADTMTRIVSATLRGTVAVAVE